MWHKPFTCCNYLQMHLHEEQKDLNWWFSKWFTTGQNLRLHKSQCINYRPAFPESYLWLLSRLNLCEFWSYEDKPFVGNESSKHKWHRSKLESKRIEFERNQLIAFLSVAFYVKYRCETQTLPGTKIYVSKR